VGRRTLFENREEIRFFLSRLARAVHQRRIEVHAWTVLTTHFHLLVRSTSGDLSRVLRDVQQPFAARFNRRRERDGPLMRGRFGSRRVRSLVDRRTVLRYIDYNPVRAGLVARPADHPWGSARSFVIGPARPWIARSWVQDSVAAATGGGAFDGPRYEAVFGRPVLERELGWIRKRMEFKATDAPDPLVDLWGATPAAVKDWLRRRTLLADGSSPGQPSVDESSVREAIRRAREPDIGRSSLARQVPCEHSTWRSLEVGLLRWLAGATLVEAGRAVGVSPSTAWALEQRWTHSMATDDEYRDRAGALVSAALGLCHAATGPQESIGDDRAP
jgi:REP element-mobilizing transposase RayT